MKTIEKMGAQGDVMFVRCKKAPAKAAEVAPVAGRVVVAHSETGHDHYLAAVGVTLLDVGDPFVQYLRVDGEYADVVHARPHDTHETLRLPRGTWEVRRQREHTPEGFRRVED